MALGRSWLSNTVVTVDVCGACVTAHLAGSASGLRVAGTAVRIPLTRGIHTTSDSGLLLQSRGSQSDPDTTEPRATEPWIALTLRGASSLGAELWLHPGRCIRPAQSQRDSPLCLCYGRTDDGFVTTRPGSVT